MLGEASARGGESHAGAKRRDPQIGLRPDYPPCARREIPAEASPPAADRHVIRQHRAVTRCLRRTRTIIVGQTVAMTLLRRLCVATLITGSIFAFYRYSSGAPARVHVMTATSLVVLFWLPALFVGSVRQLSERALPLSAWLGGAAVAYDAGTSFVVSKSEFPNPVMWPFVFLAGAGLLVVHAFVGTLNGPRPRDA